MVMGGGGSMLWAAMETSTLMGSSTKREGCTIFQWETAATIIYTNYDDDREGFRLVRTPMYSKLSSRRPTQILHMEWRTNNNSRNMI